MEIRLHHIGFIVKDIDAWAAKMFYEEQVKEVIDPMQNARLALYTNYSDSYIELIQPLNEQAFTFNALSKFGNHFNHCCYEVANMATVSELAKKHRLIQVLEPIPALLFENRMVTFYYTRTHNIIEFLLQDEM